MKLTLEQAKDRLKQFMVDFGDPVGYSVYRLDGSLGLRVYSKESFSVVWQLDTDDAAEFQNILNRVMGVNDV